MVNKTKFKETEIGVIPQDWNVKSISDISSYFGHFGDTILISLQFCYKIINFRMAQL